jgi:flagellar protein FlbD
VTRLNGTKFFINAELIQMVEEMPDTVITLVNEKKLIVLESADLVAERVIEYQRSVHEPLSQQPGA